MKSSNAVRTVLAVAIAALCVGLAAPPAIAHPAGDTDASTSVQSRPTLAEVQGFFDRFIADRLDWLAAVSAKVSADPNLRPAAKNKIAATIAKQEAALAALKAQIDSADSIAEIRSDLQSAFVMTPHFWWSWWWFRPGLRVGQHRLPARSMRHDEPLRSAAARRAAQAAAMSQAAWRARAAARAERWRTMAERAEAWQRFERLRWQSRAGEWRHVDRWGGDRWSRYSWHRFG